MKVLQVVAVLLILLTSSIKVVAQIEEVQENEFRKHKVMFAIGHAAIPAGINRHGDKVWTILPSWALDYDFRFNEKWSVGVHTDLVVENFEYENNEIVFERTRPFSTVLVGSRKFGEHLILLIGGGIELAKEKNLKLLRIGSDYSWELPKQWEIAVSMTVDFKLDAYTSCGLGLGIAKLF
ncbi:hypothetical protein [Reichenbachiella sp.]|uniref:hypothetical protein n=1 Tax=Reichenbachiella sp. TaxID=2184521 RepID=UPI003B5A63EF